MLDLQVANYKNHVVGARRSSCCRYSNHRLAESDFRQMEAYRCVMDHWVDLVGQPIHRQTKRLGLAYGRLRAAFGANLAPSISNPGNWNVGIWFSKSSGGIQIRRRNLGDIQICFRVYLADHLRHCDGHLLRDMEQVEEYRSELR